MFLSLVAHAGGYRMMVDAHNIVECQMHVGGHVFFFRDPEFMNPTHL